MSISVHVRLVHGFRFDEEDVLKITQVRGCNHITPETGKFCSECGNPTFQQQEEHLIHELTYKELEPFEYFDGNSDVNGESKYAGQYLVVGNPVQDGYLDPEDISVAHSDALERALSEKLTELGIDTSLGKFGYHVVHYFSS